VNARGFVREALQRQDEVGEHGLDVYACGSARALFLCVCEAESELESVLPVTESGFCFTHTCSGCERIRQRDLAAGG